MKAGKNNPSRIRLIGPGLFKGWAGLARVGSVAGRDLEQSEESQARLTRQTAASGLFSCLRSRCGPPRGQSFFRTFHTERMERARACFFLSLSPFPPPQTPCPTHKARAGLGRAITLMSLQGVDKPGPGSLGGKQRQPCCGNKAVEAFFIT